MEYAIDIYYLHFLKLKMNHTTSIEIDVNGGPPILALINLLLININSNYLIPYVLPVFIVLALVNNFIVILLLVKNVGISKSLRLYYIVIAIQDLFIISSSHIWHFIGILLIFLVWGISSSNCF